MASNAPTLAERLDEDAKQALRGGEKLRLNAIRRARAAIKNAEIENRGPLADEATVRVLRGLVKQSRESIEHFQAGGRDDLLASESETLAVIEGYLPAQLEGPELEALVAEVIASEGAEGPAALGKVMKASMARVGGRADGSQVRAIAQRLLAG